MDVAQAARKNLLAIANAYGRATKLARASVSRKFHGNQAFLGEYAARRCSVTVDKLDEMVRKFRRDWPEGVPWPDTTPIDMTRG